MKKFATFSILLLLLLFLTSCADGSAASDSGSPETLPLHREHVFGDWQITTLPSCTNVGIEARSCTVCQLMETRQVEPLGHTFGEWCVTLAPACTASGTQTRTCSVCGSFDTEAIQPTGHSFGEWVVTLSPLCEVKGIETQACTVCNASVTKEIPPTGHPWEETWIQTLAPTCEQKGNMTLYCSVCEKTQVREIKPSGHSYSLTESKRATLTEDGYETYTCASCPSTERKIFYATGSLGIDFTKESAETCLVTGIGSFTGNSLVLPSYHDGLLVVGIAQDAFSECASLQSVVISDTVTFIGKSAFEGCPALQSVRLGAEVTEIGESAFLSCSSLTELRGGDGLTTIGKFAFWGCSQLSSLTLSASLSTVEELAFHGCGNLVEIFYKGTSIGDWTSIVIASDNTPLTTAERFYYSEEQPTTIGKFWHLVDGVITKW